MLQIKDLHASVEGQQILQGIDLHVKAGEVHAIMGPNGSGKSTLANVLAGRDGYDVTAGSIRFLEKELLDMEPEERACAGLFLAFQYPVEIPGVNNMYFLKAALNAIRKARGEEDLDAMDFWELVNERLKRVKMDESFLKRPVNEGFSGGEKKRNEVLQLSVLEPLLRSTWMKPILDFDIDALKVVAEGVNALRSAQSVAFLVITHYQRLLNYIQPDIVHVLVERPRSPVPAAKS